MEGGGNKHDFGQHDRSDDDNSSVIVPSKALIAALLKRGSSVKNVGNEAL